MASFLSVCGAPGRHRTVRSGDLGRFQVTSSPPVLSVSGDKGHTYCSDSGGIRIVSNRVHLSPRRYPESTMASGRVLAHFIYAPKFDGNSILLLIFLSKGRPRRQLTHFRLAFAPSLLLSCRDPGDKGTAHLLHGRVRGDCLNAS